MTVIPPILQQLGFVPVGPQRMRMFITNEGPPGTGKTQFIRTCPGPIGLVDFDRGAEGVLEYDCYGNPIMRKTMEAPDFDEAGKTMSAAEWATAKKSYEQFKQVMAAIIKSGQVRTIGVDTGGAAYALAQAARFGRIAQVGEVPAAMWTQMQAEYEHIFQEAYDHGCNIVVTHRQGSKFKGMAGEKELKGYKAMEFVGQVHLVHQKRTVYTPDPAFPTDPTKNKTAVELSLMIKKCRPRIGIDGKVLPVYLLGEDQNGVMQSFGGRFIDVAREVFPNAKAEDWFDVGRLKNQGVI